METRFDCCTNAQATVMQVNRTAALQDNLNLFFTFIVVNCMMSMRFTSVRINFDNGC